MVRNSILVVFFLLVHTVVFSQQNRYMVFFKDKNGTPYTISNPGEFLSPRAITRRLAQGIEITQDDLPVNTSYVQGVKGAGADVFFSSRWFNGVLIQCEESIVSALQSLPYVARVELSAPKAKLSASGRRKNNLKNKNTKSLGVTDEQLRMIGIDKMHEAGYRGEGITIAIFDSGFSGVDVTAPFEHIINEQRIDMNVSHDFVRNSDYIFQYDDHGTEVFSIIGAYQPETFTGGAYEAHYQLYVTEEVSTEYRVEEYNWLFAAERADSAGADIIQASLGYYDFDISSMNYPQTAMDGNTTVVTRAAQMAADRGMVVVCSAGNEGALAWQIITAPADARDVLAIASVNQQQQRSATSSIGPSADGRIKPDVAALGVGTSVIKPNGTVGTASGTSLATPLVTSLVAGVWQRYPDLTNKEVMDAIRYSSSQAHRPDNLLGYGIPDFEAIVQYLEQREQKKTFEVFPNPVYEDSLVIRPFDPLEVSRCNVTVLSVHGQRIFEDQIEFSGQNRTYQADLSSLAAGIYFVHISWGEKKYSYKVVRI